MVLVIKQIMEDHVNSINHNIITTEDHLQIIHIQCHHLVIIIINNHQVIKIKDGIIENINIKHHVNHNNNNIQQMRVVFKKVCTNIIKHLYCNCCHTVSLSYTERAYIDYRDKQLVGHPPLLPAMDKMIKACCVKYATNNRERRKEIALGLTNFTVRTHICAEGDGILDDFDDLWETYETGNASHILNVASAFKHSIFTKIPTPPPPLFPPALNRKHTPRKTQQTGDNGIHDLAPFAISEYKKGWNGSRAGSASCEIVQGGVEGRQETVTPATPGKLPQQARRDSDHWQWLVGDIVAGFIAVQMGKADNIKGLFDRSMLYV